jgi:NADPH2:quinone reductase
MMRAWVLQRYGEPNDVLALQEVDYVTAYHALHTRAHLAPRETVIVNGGAGGVGSAAIQLARAAGARVVATDIGPDRVKSCLAYGAEVAVDPSTEHLVAAVTEFSAGHGADVVLDAVGGEVFHACRRCIASEGRIVIIGFTSGEIPTLRLNQLILRNFTVMGMNAFVYAPRFGSVMREIVDLWATGKVNPPVEREYSFEETPLVFTRLALTQE